MHVIAMLLAGLSRALVGNGTASRWAVYPPAAALAAWYGFGMTWWALAFGVCVMLLMIGGYTEWENKAYMAIRYGGVPTLLAILAQSHPALIWAGACLATGYSYNWMKHIVKDLNFKYSDQVPEFIAGAVIIGGIALL